MLKIPSHPECTLDLLNISTSANPESDSKSTISYFNYDNFLLI